MRGGKNQRRRMGRRLQSRIVRRELAILVEGVQERRIYVASLRVPGECLWRGIYVSVFVGVVAESALLRLRLVTVHGQARQGAVVPKY